MHSQNLLFLHLLLLLPGEIIEDILSRLPVKSLLICRCVSKSWLSLIDSDRFIKIHFQYTSLAHQRVIFHVKRKRDLMNECSLQSLLNPNPKEGSSSITIVPTSNLPKRGSFVSCCNGVLCISNYPDDWNYSLWNPATRVFMELPKLKNQISTKRGFGWDESSGAFKVFASVFDCSNKRSGQVYSSKTKSWKTVPFGSLNLLNLIGVFVGGRLHWAIGLRAGDEHYIESFNLESDEFGRIELPPFNAIAIANEGSLLCMSLGEIWGCLCTLFDHNKNVDVWIMNKYGMKESWFKLLTFPLGVSKRTIHAFPPVIGERPNGEIIMIFGDTLMVYSPKDDVFSTPTNANRFYRACIYVESLVSPQTNATRSSN